MHRKQVIIAFIICTVLFQQSCTLWRSNCIDLNQEVEYNGTSTYILNPVNNLVPSFDTTCNGIKYTIGVVNCRINFIITNDANFSCDRLTIGMPLPDKFKNRKIKSVPGWGKFVQVKYDWYAACLSREDDFIIDCFFKFREF